MPRTASQLRQLTRQADQKQAEAKAPRARAEDQPQATPSQTTQPIHADTDARRTYRSIVAKMVVTDALCIVAALVIAKIIRFGGAPLGPYAPVVALSPLIWVGVFHAYRLYATKNLSPVEEFRRIISAVSVGMVFLIMGSFWLKASYSRAWIALTWVAALALELLVRRIWRAHVAKLQQRGELKLRTLIIGANDEAGRIAEAFTATAHLGFEPIGYISSTDISTANHLPTIGSIALLEDAIEEHQADCLFVASTAITPDEMQWVSYAARKKGIEVKVSANMPEMLSSRITVQQLGTIMALNLRPAHLTSTQEFTKRAFDLVVSLTAMLIALPVMAVIFLAIKLTEDGPAIFKQTRVTKGAEEFRLYKFSTMVQNGDRILRDKGIDPSQPFFKLGEDDPRITKVGRSLRKASLDELPQLFNVIKGDMSLVGPRPLPKDQVAANAEMLSPRLEVKGGVTGWWQIHGRSDVSPIEAVQLDTFYIENWSLTLDLFVLAKTLGVLVRRAGAQ